MQRYHRGALQVVVACLLVMNGSLGESEKVAGPLWQFTSNDIQANPLQQNAQLCHARLSTGKSKTCKMVPNPSNQDEE